MEYRKLIKLGKETFSITLPKQWVVNHRLSKGDNISIEEEGDGSLRIHPKEDDHTSEIKEITIDVSRMTLKEIKRQILVAYVNDFSIINLKGDFGNRAKELRNVFHEFLALEVLDIKTDLIAAKAFIDISETNPMKIIRRIDTIIKTMFTEIEQCLNHKGSREPVSDADAEVDRLYHFTMKLITRGLQNANMARHWGYSPTDLALLMLLSDRLEKISDRGKHIASFFSSVKFSGKERELLTSKLGELEKNYRNAITSFYKNDTTMANAVINSIREEDKSILNNRRFPCLFGEDDNCKCAIPVVFEFLARIFTITEDIARIVLILNPKDIPKGTLSD